MEWQVDTCAVFGSLAKPNSVLPSHWLIIGWLVEIRSCDNPNIDSEPYDGGQRDERDLSVFGPSAQGFGSDYMSCRARCNSTMSVGNQIPWKVDARPQESARRLSLVECLAPISTEATLRLDEGVAEDGRMAGWQDGTRTTDELLGTEQGEAEVRQGSVKKSNACSSAEVQIRLTSAGKASSARPKASQAKLPRRDTFVVNIQKEVHNNRCM